MAAVRALPLHRMDFDHGLFAGRGSPAQAFPAGYQASPGLSHAVVTRGTGPVLRPHHGRKLTTSAIH